MTFAETKVSLYFFIRILPMMGINTCKVDYILINAYLFDSRYSDLTMLFNQSGLLYFSLRTSLKNKIGEIGSASGVFYSCPLGKEQMEKVFGTEYRNSINAYFSRM